MLYDLSKAVDVERIRTKLEYDTRHGNLVSYERKVIRTKRQNSYMHLLLGAVAVETGNPLEYVKQEYFKALVNPALFVRQKEDAFLHQQRNVLRSSRDLTTEEMNLAIDRFKRWAAENGIYLPEPGDEERLREIALEMARQERYL